jgi:cell division protein ZapA (FtsZ GTPase activity inhibitor)
VSHQYGAKLAGREHVVRQDKMLGKNHANPTTTHPSNPIDLKRGLFVHTVMFYGLKDKIAPVYENENLLHMLDILKRAQQKREVWYYPESAYWISFDNAVPMFLMPYLQTRLEDILLMDSLGVDGHLTFSSGWEWGYWLIDWSIARWSWEHQFNGKIIPPRATQFLTDLLPQETLIKTLNQLSKLQQQYIKDQQLIRYLVAQTVTDELPEPLNLELHPRPWQSYRWLSYKANKDDLLILEQKAIRPLQQFSQTSDSLLKTLKEQSKLLDQGRKFILDELCIALEVTQLRAAHKAATLSLLSAKRKQKMNTNALDNTLQLSEKCENIRLKAQVLVAKQEKNYRYPLEWIARKQLGKGSTCYDFGYLYPVSNLHFWLREEQQIIQNKFGPFFMSIWDIPRIMGIVD